MTFLAAAVASKYLISGRHYRASPFIHPIILIIKLSANDVRLQQKKKKKKRNQTVVKKL